MPRSKRHRTLVRAAKAWNAGERSLALDQLKAAGLGDYRRTFIRNRTTVARERYLDIMDTYQEGTPHDL